MYPGSGYILRKKNQDSCTKFYFYTNRVCREQFVNLHSQPILENLSQHFEKTYITDNLDDALPTDSDLVRAKELFNSIPEKGTLNLDVVKDSVYFFS